MQVSDSYALPPSSTLTGSLEVRDTGHASRLLRGMESQSPAYSHPSPRHTGQEELGLLIQHPEIKASAATAIGRALGAWKGHFWS